MKIHSLSASKIKTEEMCQFKYYLEYVKEIKLTKTFAADQGTLVHAVFQKFGEAKRDGIENPEIKSKWIDLILKGYQEGGIWKLSKKALEREKDCQNCEYFQENKCFIVNQEVDKFKGCPKVEFDEAIWLVEKVINDPGCNNPLNQKVIDVENKFSIYVGQEQIKVNGVIDIVTELDKETIEIVDYKSGNYMMTQQECETDPQLLIYHLAARTTYKDYKNILITIYYLKNKPITLAFNQKDEIGTVNAIVRRYHKIKNNKTPVRRCDFIGKDGTTKTNFDWKCKAMCAPEICKVEWVKFQQENNGISEDE